jgi:hypothetical protein
MTSHLTSSTSVVILLTEVSIWVVDHHSWKVRVAFSTSSPVGELPELTVSLVVVVEVVDGRGLIKTLGSLKAKRTTISMPDGDFVAARNVHVVLLELLDYNI